LATIRGKVDWYKCTLPLSFLLSRGDTSHWKRSWSRLLSIHTPSGSWWYWQKFVCEHHSFHTDNLGIRRVQHNLLHS
jgi:hypothetical protein